MAALALALALGACGREVEPERSRVTRVALQPAPDARPLAAPTELSLIDPDGGWQVQAPLWGLAVPDWLPSGSSPMLQLAAAGPAPTLRALWSQPLDAARARRLRVELAFDGDAGATLALQLLRRGQVVAEGPPRPLEPRGARRTIDLELPVGVGRFDGLGLVCRGSRRVLGLGAARLLALEPGVELPEAGEGARLVRLGGAARRAVGLLPGRALEAEVEVPPDARLLLAWGQPLAAATEGPAPEWELTVDDGPPLRSTGGERGPDGAVPWRTRSVDMAAYAGREVRMRFELLQQDRGALALAVPELGAVDVAAPTVLLVTGDRGALVDRVVRRGGRMVDLRPCSDDDHVNRLALLTGRHPRDSGWLTDDASVPSDVTTLAEVFARAGYVTAAAVAGASSGPGATGLGQGFDRVSWPSAADRDDDADVLIELLGWLPEVEGRPLFAWVDLADDGTEAGQERSASLMAVDRLRDGLVAVLGVIPEGPPGAGPVAAAWSGPTLVAGEAWDRPARWIDVGATLASAAAVDREGLPGRDLFVPAPGGSTARFALGSAAGSASIDEDGLCLVLTLEADGSAVRHGVRLLADGDPARDFAEQRPDDARRLRARLLRWLAGATVPEGAPALFVPDGCAACARWDG